MANTAYSGRATETTDEGNGTANVQRVTQVDGLGRLVSVCEVGTGTALGSGGTPGSCGQHIAATGFLTTYTYSALDDLASVTQATVNRSFVYDSLSRMTSATNPESGIASYTYDADGNLIQRVRPAPNQTNPSVTVTTNYTYDALNRLTGITYSDGATPAVCNMYDQAVVYGSIPVSNPIGRLTQSQVQQGSTVLSANAPLSYDALGRLISNGLCTPRTCGWGGDWLSFSYDLAGDATQIVSNLGFTITTAYDNATRLSEVTSTLSDGQHPGSLLSNT